MDVIAHDVVYCLAELQYEQDDNTGQRWPVILPAGKQHVLNFRTVCRSFRDASWIPFREVLAERIFYLNEGELAILDSIARHPRLGPLLTTVTLGSQIFTEHGLEILQSGLQSHPLYANQNAVVESAWQTGLASKCNLCYHELVRFKELYEVELSRQEKFWSTGAAVNALSNCLSRLPNLSSIRIYPRPCHVSFQVRPGGKDGKLFFTSLQHNHHFVRHGAVNNIRCYGWRNIDRTLIALSKLTARYVFCHRPRYTSKLANREGKNIDSSFIATFDYLQQTCFES
ncbi:hypothetical protein, variant [Verruconis gallopava]|uniref:Uncharacterized protein n=1 Tax=Verruconis gallopava TaxID=253628 RepID=A0A0D2A6Q5_9PEZI|nr:hypothetical protein, variant [Verruconis gallopava]KIW02408.1 hypothetical protein, variant [Verruconis gallopava]